MVLHLGSKKVILTFENQKNNLIIPTKIVIPNNILLSLDGYVLKDSNGLYLISKEEE